MKPKRIQRKRTKDWRKPENAVIVDRTSRYGNPYKIGQNCNSVLELALMGFKGDALTNGVRINTNADAVDMYKRMLNTFTTKRQREFFAPLRGKDLVCFCKLDDPCHADVLLKLANH